jgi:hypothetical protein
LRGAEPADVLEVVPSRTREVAETERRADEHESDKRLPTRLH